MKWLNSGVFEYPTYIQDFENYQPFNYHHHGYELRNCTVYGDFVQGNMPDRGISRKYKENLIKIFEWLNSGSNRYPVKLEENGNYIAPKPTRSYYHLQHFYKNRLNTCFRNGNNDLILFTVLIKIFNWYEFGTIGSSFSQLPTSTCFYQEEDYIDDYNEHLYLCRPTNDFRIMGDDICPSKDLIISIFEWLTWGDSEITFIIKKGSIDSYHPGLYHLYNSGEYIINQYAYELFGDGYMHGDGCGSYYFTSSSISYKVNRIIAIFEWLNTTNHWKHVKLTENDKT